MNGVPSLAFRLQIGQGDIYEEPLTNSCIGACRLKEPGSTLKNFTIVGYYVRFSP
jgi:hypothetical protein